MKIRCPLVNSLKRLFALIELFLQPYNMKDISILNIDSIEGLYRLSAAHLVMQSLPLFYHVDGIEDGEIATAIAASIGGRGSEIEKGYVAVYGDQAVGILTFIEGKMLASARLVGVQAVLKHLSRNSAKLFMRHLKHYDADYGSVPDTSIYLGRFAISQAYRGSGLANQMMDVFLTSMLGGEQRIGTYSLHVDSSNKRAIAFYRKHSFSISQSDSRYLTMIREPKHLNRGHIALDKE